jgi:hypothetical protein
VTLHILPLPDAPADVKFGDASSISATSASAARARSINGQSSWWTEIRRPAVPIGSVQSAIACWRHPRCFKSTMAGGFQIRWKVVGTPPRVEAFLTNNSQQQA